MSRVVSDDEHLDDIGPDPDAELEFGGYVEFAPDFRIVLAVPFSEEALSGISSYARGEGIDSVAAVQRLVDEALAAHPQPRR
jgi:hypothetical protein